MVRGEPLLTLDDVARRLNADITIVAHLISLGELAALEIAPGMFRVAPSDYRRFINVRRADFVPRHPEALAS